MPRFIVAEMNELYQPSAYYMGHEDIVTADVEYSRPIWKSGFDALVNAYRFEDEDDARRFADDMQSYARAKGWPISYSVEEGGQ